MALRADADYFAGQPARAHRAQTAFAIDVKRIALWQLFVGLPDNNWHDAIKTCHNYGHQRVRCRSSSAIRQEDQQIHAAWRLTRDLSEARRLASG